MMANSGFIVLLTMDGHGQHDDSNMVQQKVMEVEWPVMTMISSSCVAMVNGEQCC